MEFQHQDTQKEIRGFYAADGNAAETGTACVEWYFGARCAHNDLSSEDWRQRDRLWAITRHAKTFFQDHLPYWDMQARHELVGANRGYGLAKPDETYALYVPDFSSAALDLQEASGTFRVRWFDPLEGGDLQSGTVASISGGKRHDLGDPPSRSGEDWVVLVQKS